MQWRMPSAFRARLGPAAFCVGCTFTAGFMGPWSSHSLNKKAGSARKTQNNTGSAPFPWPEPGSAPRTHCIACTAAVQVRERCMRSKAGSGTCWPGMPARRLESWTACLCRRRLYAPEHALRPVLAPQYALHPFYRCPVGYARAISVPPFSEILLSDSRSRRPNANP